MTITKESFVDLEEKYTKVVKLIEEDSKSDPETEPYLSKYSARQILIGMKANIENLLRSQSSESQEALKLAAMLGAVYLYLGTISIDTEELTVGEKHLEKCREVTEQHESLPEFILVTLNMYNQFGILWSQREPEKSKVYLEKSDSLYSKFKETSITPIDISDLFKTNVDSYDSEMAYKNFEKIHTLTLYYLAQIFGALKDALKSSVYCHITLQRQLEMDDYEPIDWALNAATLSQFFMEKCGFKQARHHLAASSFILEKHGKELSSQEQNEALDAELETLKHRSADVARCWAKYGLFILSKSKERLLSHTDNIEERCKMISDLSKLEISDDCTVSPEHLQQLDFTGIDITEIESQITDQFVLTLDDAKKVFLNIQKWISKAQEYYNLETHASDFIETAQDQSQMYLNLLFFEDSPDNQAKLHKRRVDLLENVINNINSQYYLQYCRQIWFELGKCYSEILDIKTEKLQESKDRPKPQALAKINNLVDKSIMHYRSFVNSFIESSTGKLPEKIADDAEMPFLQAYFYIAALHGRYIVLDKTAQIKNVENQYENYKFISDYCDRNEKAKELVSMEIGICRDMVRLLPMKIFKLKHSL